MGGIFFKNIEGEILQSLRKDNPKKLKDIIIKQNLNPESVYTNRKRTLIQLSCYYISPKCLSALIELNYDYNKKEISNNYTPLYIACKFNSLEIVKILLKKDDCAILQKTDDNFNEFEIAFLKGNYDICYFLLYQYKNENNNINNTPKDEKDNEEDKENNDNNVINDKDKDKDVIVLNKKRPIPKNSKINPNTDQPYQRYFLSAEFDIDTFLSLQKNNQAPLFNMELFYQSLLNRVPPNKCPSFAAERKRSKEMLSKIPDPNETWGHFFKRLVNFELYNPPMVDKRNVSHMNSMYMNAQMKLMESEYGIKLSYYNENEDNNENRGQGLDDSREDDEKDIFKVNKKRNDVDDNNENSQKDSTQENILKINIKKSLKNSDKEKKDNGNKIEENIIRNQNNFYQVEINNTSEREIKKDDFI